MDIKEIKSILQRFAKGTQTAADEKLVAQHAAPGENGWNAALERFTAANAKKREEQLSLFLDNGLMFGFKDDDSAAPKQILRSALFAPIARGRRKVLNRYSVAQFKGGELLYSGVQLDQADLDVMLLLTRLLSDSSVTGNVTKISGEDGRQEYSRIKFSRYAFLKKIKKSLNKQTYDWLDDSLRRLTGELEVKIEGEGKMAGAIVGKRALDERTGLMMVDINQDYVRLFGDDGFSFVNLAQRLTLSGGFAKWLHCFISTHRGKSTYSAEKLMELSKCKNSRTRQWMQRQATPAFESLLETEAIKKFSVKGHLYTWVR